jgi:aerobic carbon-monoxide dehydrogenase large subunit
MPLLRLRRLSPYNGMPECEAPGGHVSGKTFGRSVPRQEDRALLTGKGRFVADIRLDGMLHVAFLRSPHAHAKIRSIDVAAARALPGVHAVFTAADIRKHVITDRLAVALPDKTYRQRRDRPILASRETVYVGEPLAMVVAESAYIAEDAASLIEIEFEALPAAVDCRDALKPGAPLAHSDGSDNLIAQFSSSYGDVEAAFSGATHILRESFRTHRGCAVFMEGRGCLATVDRSDDQLTVWSSTQTPLVAARLLSEILGREESSIRVITPDVGGGFGPKLVFYQEEAAVAAASVALGRPVRWLEDRREHFISTTQERDQFWDVEIALDADGRLRGLRGKLLHDHGAYTARGLTVPQGAIAAMSLAYDLPAFRMDVQVALTNKVPVTPVRGAGQPQGVFVMERMLDLAACELNIDRADIRRRNLIPNDRMPYTKGFMTRGGVPVVLDSGDYPACQADALKRIDWDGFRARQKQARAQGRYLGLGLANFVEGTGRGPYEQVSIRIAPSGLIHVATGAAAMGQSTKTMLAQIVAEHLGGGMDRVLVTAGDSGKISAGFGGFNSRQAVMAGSSAQVAAVKVRQKILDAASHLLEADAGDLDIEGDNVFVKGAAEMKMPLADVAKAMIGAAGFRLPGGLAPGLEATESVVIDAMTYGNGSAAVEVEVDVGTGRVAVTRVAFVHDAGRLINPMIVEGQVVGALVHGIGNALYEHMGYSEDGQPLATTLADYLVMTADAVPAVDLGHMESPTPLNPLGVKGVGESGVIPMPAAVASAIEDALSEFGAQVTHFPILPSDIVAMVANAKRA